MNRALFLLFTFLPGLSIASDNFVFRQKIGPGYDKGYISKGITWEEFAINNDLYYEDDWSNLYWSNKGLTELPTVPHPNENPSSIFLDGNPDLNMYGGLSNIKTIDGLYIGGTLSIVDSGFSSLLSASNIYYSGDSIDGKEKDLSELSSLIEVGSIYLDGGDDITSLKGLDSLKIVHNYIFFPSTEKIKTLDGLGSLNNVNELFLGDLVGLESFMGASGFVNMGDIYFPESYKVKDFSGLESLKTVNNMYASELYSIESFKGLDGLSYINDFYMSSGSNIKNFEGLEGLTEVDDLFFDNISTINSFIGLNNISKAGRLFFGGGDATNVSGLDSLIHANGIYLNDFPELTSLYGLNLESVGSLTLGGSPKLSDISQLSSLRVANGIYFSEEHDIVDFSSLSFIESLDSLFLGNNKPYLKSAYFGDCDRSFRFIPIT